MGVFCCGRDQQDKRSTRLKKRQSKDFDAEDFGSDADGNDRVAREIMFEMESKDREFDQNDKEALAKKQDNKPQQYKGWKTKS